MLALYVALLAAAWLIEAAEDNPSYQPHGVVAFIRSGERTPLIASNTSVLSALGAQQMYKLGQNFRGRYIDIESEHTGLGQEPLNGMMLNLLNTKQLLIQTLDKPHLVSSAQAFMQGLYPPYSINNTRNGPIADATGILADGTAIDFPLQGYQYPLIEALSPQDPDSVYMSGQDNCPYSEQQSLMYQTTKDYLDTKIAARSFYQSLDESLFDGHLDSTGIDYANAFKIYDYLNYAYMHDTNVHETLNDSANEGVYDQLRYYADESAWYFWGNTSADGTDDDIRAMAGKTAAARILGQFQKIVSNNGNTTNGESQPLTLLFGEHEPLISLFSLIMIDHRFESFRAIPPFASTVVFELFSVGTSTEFPSDPEDLWVRFHFQNGTEYDDSLRSYPIFNNGPSRTDLPWIEFQDMMSRIMLTSLEDWCKSCSSGSLFCWGVDDTTTSITYLSSSRNGKVSPTVAGVIGAIVTLCVAGLLFALAMLIGGIRFHRVERNNRKSDLGGFKGSAKLTSDADLNLPKNGVAPAGIVSFGAATDTQQQQHPGRKTPHERVGSWELRQKEFGPGAGATTKASGDLGDESPRASFEAIEAAMARPVQPSERV